MNSDQKPATIAKTANPPGSAASAELPQVLKTHVLPGPPHGDPYATVIMRRVPTHESYPQHENIDPMAYKPDLTDRDVDGRYDGTSSSMAQPGAYWKKYTHNPETFSRNPPPEDSFQQNQEV